ncbi:MAG: tail fiber domain-containing protein [Bacteroidales bacterium]|nr:tail fiber domain-containing protein [Bacteroidales bacterium]
MKNLLISCLALLAICSIPSFSQVKYTSGKFGIGATIPLSPFSLGSTGYSDCTASIYSSNSSIYRGLRVHHLPNDDDYNFGIISSIGYNSNSWKIAGIYSAAYRETNTNSIYTYGIRAYAGRGHDGLNYGVMGKLVGDRDGAGIFGCDSQNAEVYVIGDFAGYFRGDVKMEDDLYVLGSINPSDKNLKKDIRLLGHDNISKLNQLNGIIYKLKHPTELSKNWNSESDTTNYLPLDHPKYTKDRIGLIAQEVQEVYPELVGEDNEGYLTLNYTNLIPALIEAIKEQQIEITALSNQVNSISGEVKKSSSDLQTDSPSSDLSQSELFQNIPNPFYENTIIKYSVPEINSYAMINVYDLQGSQVISFNVAQSGDGEIMIPGSELNPGIFIYNLIVDGTEIASRRMVLVD